MTAGGGTGAKDFSLPSSAPVARLTTPPAQAHCGVLTGGLPPGHPHLLVSDRASLPRCLPPSSSHTMTGQQVGGGSEAMPRTSGLRAQKEVQAATSAEIERLAAAAVAGLGAGKGAAAKPASFSIRQLTLGWIDWHRFRSRHRHRLGSGYRSRDRHLYGSVVRSVA